MNKMILSLILSLLLPIQANAINDDAMGISIHNPWVRSAPLNAPVLGAFMQINNPTDKEVKLIAIRADGYKRVEIHRTVNDGGIMRMNKHAFASIPAGGMLHFKPGSWHIMLIKPEQVPSKGSVVPIKLEFDNSVVQTVFFQVKSGEKIHNYEY